MRTLYLLRHAKSDWSDAKLRDHDRPLAGRGRRAAPAMAEYMEAEGLLPRIVLCSTAVRTQQTWELMEERIGSGSTVVYEKELYGASPREITRIVARVADEADPVMVVGHNPGLQDAAVGLAARGDDRELERMERKFPTAALAVLQASIDGWAELESVGCILERFVRPKDLPRAEERRL